MTSDRLKPCPFCGHIPCDYDGEFDSSANGVLACIGCPNCGCEGPAVVLDNGSRFSADSEAELVKAWNRRAADARSR